MAQDQIAKLMAIAGRSTDADECSSALSAADGAAQIRSAAAAWPKGFASACRQPLPSQAANDHAARRVARRRPAGPVRGKIAANDDVPSIGGLDLCARTKALDQDFPLAAIASVVWAIVGIAYGAFTLVPEWSAGATVASLLLHPVTFYTATAVIVPIAIFWLLALLNWHIASLALKSSTMTEVAIRLAEPDRAAEQSIASLGQAVRRQVSFMNDAVSRALGRAGELEALVHNQVADLERSYEQNERRIRGLIQELTGERHALSQHVGQRHGHAQNARHRNSAADRKTVDAAGDACRHHQGRRRKPRQSRRLAWRHRRAASNTCSARAPSNCRPFSKTTQPRSRRRLAPAPSRCASRSTATCRHSIRRSATAPKICRRFSKNTPAPSTRRWPTAPRRSTSS